MSALPPENFALAEERRCESVTKEAEEVEATGGYAERWVTSCERRKDVARTRRYLNIINVS